MSKIPLLLLPVLLTGACAPPPAPPEKSIAIVPAPTPRRAMHGRSMPPQELRPIDGELMKAVSEGQVDRVRKLLEKGANANAQSASDGNALSVLSGVDRTRDLAIAKLLIEHGADVNYSSPTQGYTPLTHAILGVSDPLPVIRFLLTKGAKVNEPMRDGTTALHLAVNWGHAEVVRELVKYGANLGARTLGSENVVADPQFDRQLPAPNPIARPEPNFRDSGQTPVFGLVDHWDPQVFAILQKAKADFRATDDNGWTVVHYAVRTGNLVALDAFLKMGLDPNAASKQGYRPAHAAVRPATFGNQPAQTLARLRVSGANLSEKNGEGQSPLDTLRAEIDRLFTEGRFPASLGQNERRKLLAEANAVAKILDPGASPIVAPKPVVDAKGTHYSDFDLGEFKAKRAIRVEGDRAILTLTIPNPPKTPTRFTWTGLWLHNYEALTPLPKTIELQPGRTEAVTFEFPAPAAKSAALHAEWTFTQSDHSKGQGSMNEGGPMPPTFSHRPNGPLEVAHSIPGRTLVFQILSASRAGKPVANFPKKAFTLRPDQSLPLTGLAPVEGLEIKYRSRLLPNQRWIAGQMRF